jgi:predicted dehydrogenase
VYLVSPRIGIGLIGTGNIGRVHLTALSALKVSGLLNLEISAVCDTNKDSLNSIDAVFNPTATYEDYTELIKDPNVDVIYICTPTDLHSDMVKAAAEAKKPIMCEKPLAHSCPQARDLVAVTQSSNVISGVGLVLRYDQFLLHAKKLIEELDFGRPMLAHIRDDQHFPIDYIYESHWRGDITISGGGTLIEHSIHDIDILLWFFGEIESVYAKTSNFSEREVEDQASLIMTHRSGLISTLDSIWHWIERPSERRIEFFFEKGYIEINLETGDRYLTYQLQGETPVRVNTETANNTLIETLGLHAHNLDPTAYKALTSSESERYAAMSYSFLKTVLNSGSPSPSFMDAVSAHKIVDAAYSSASENQPIDPL